ncbi:hypothetical protein YC2023_040923 [Brassica napus]
MGSTIDGTPCAMLQISSDIYAAVVGGGFLEEYILQNLLMGAMVSSTIKYVVNIDNIAISVLLIFQYLWNLTDANVVFLCFKILSIHSVQGADYHLVLEISKVS